MMVDTDYLTQNYNSNYTMESAVQPRVTVITATETRAYPIEMIAPLGIYTDTLFETGSPLVLDDYEFELVDQVIRLNIINTVTSYPASGAKISQTQSDIVYAASPSHSNSNVKHGAQQMGKLFVLSPESDQPDFVLDVAMNSSESFSKWYTTDELVAAAHYMGALNCIKKFYDTIYLAVDQFQFLFQTKYAEVITDLANWALSRYEKLEPKFRQLCDHAQLSTAYLRGYAVKFLKDTTVITDNGYIKEICDFCTEHSISDEKQFAELIGSLSIDNIPFNYSGSNASFLFGRGEQPSLLLLHPDPVEHNSFTPDKSDLPITRSKFRLVNGTDTTRFITIESWYLERVTKTKTRPIEHFKATFSSELDRVFFTRWESSTFSDEYFCKILQDYWPIVLIRIEETISNYFLNATKCSVINIPNNPCKLEFGFRQMTSDIYAYRCEYRGHNYIVVYMLGWWCYLVPVEHFQTGAHQVVVACRRDLRPTTAKQK